MKRRALAKRTLAALLAALLLCGSALAAEEPPRETAEEPQETVEETEPVQAQETEEEPVQEPEEVLPPVSGEEDEEEAVLLEEEPEEEIVEDYFLADLLQDGSFTGPFTDPTEATLYDDEAAVAELLYQAFLKRGNSPNTDGTSENDGGIVNVSAYSFTAEKFREIYSKVVNDHPELFYVHKACGLYGYSNKITEMHPNYYDGRTITYNGGETEITENLIPEIAEFNAKVNEIVADVTKQNFTSKLEKALYIHDYLVVNCRYNWDVAFGNRDNAPKRVWTALGALIDGDAVCQGYTLAYKLLLNRVGVESVYVESNLINHIWNLVQMDNGNWYHVDATWDDPTPNGEGKCSHKNFLRSDQGILDTGHKKDGKYDWKNQTESYKSTDDSYYSGSYIFHDIEWPVYRTNGKYYTLARVTVETTSSSYTEYRVNSYDTLGPNSNSEDSLTISPLMRITTIPDGKERRWGSTFGVVWKDGCLNYIGRDSLLHCVDLLTKKEITSDQDKPLDLTKVTFNDDVEKNSIDSLGLRYRDGKFEVLRSYDYNNVIQSFEELTFPTYPPEWENQTGILDVTEKNQAGIRLEGTSGAATLYVATYSGGRMTGVKSYPVTLTAGEVALVQLPSAPTANDKLMLVLNNKPVCAAYTPAA